ncbi:MAG: hypothetical protein A9Z00_11610 [Thermobacillus sp. ZCTH02-B1]|uniref:DUF92 domain-containing protein n=1 Tax=Thermobacillus sp. ZCTH02-B1 TaxID=1858795 RepID=UPI000B55B258|nr:DUF92 domain-containing protein [Thermobacillus sp. ZCTH02-B1]OUM93666.1 MAG: hypothetical protein A9Z00_11610 [Thermobacillus sp. ZCTH02-B1]
MVEAWNAPLPLRWAAGLAGAGLIAWIAWRGRALTASGAWSAAAMGGGYFALGGPFWYGLLLAFFMTSVFWSRWKRHARSKREAEKRYAKTGRRDAGQVWANGGVGLALLAAYAIRPEPLIAAAFVGVMASVNADTWATEIGALSRAEPRSVLTGRAVPAGTSGGVTPLGTAAALAGAALIGAAAALLGGGAATGLPAGALVALAAASGLAGAMADSLLGAWQQGLYRCLVCGELTERTVHCGEPALHAQGRRWMTNDAVNCLSSVVAGGIAALIALPAAI